MPQVTLEMLDTLARLRMEEEAAKKKVEALESQLRITNANAYELQVATKDARAGLEMMVRQGIEEEYRSTDDHKPFPGTSIALVTKLQYDEEEALRWATEYRCCLSLDKKAFEYIAKRDKIPCVTETKEPQVRIVTNLAQVLDEEKAKTRRAA